MAVKMNLIWEKDRLETFKLYWPFGENSSCSAYKMANAGFFFCGTKSDPNYVKCFICGKELGDWAETEDPMQEHKNHCPECPFVVINKEEKDMTIHDILCLIKKLWKETLKNDIKKSVSKRYGITLDDNLDITNKRRE